MLTNVWDEITYPFLNLNSNVITYPRGDLS